MNQGWVRDQRLALFGDEVFFIAKPIQNERPVAFGLNSSAGGMLVFENHDHDFPQRIIYRHDAGDNLHARIAGQNQAKAAAVDFKFSRVH